MTLVSETIPARLEIAPIEAQDLPAAVNELIRGGGRMQMAYARYAGPGIIELRYVGSRGQREDFFAWRCDARGPVPSVAAVSPLLGWYEREITDLFGVEFHGHPEPHRLVLHQGVRPVLPPFDPAYPEDVMLPFEPTEGGLPEIASDDVQRLPFGPVRSRGCVRRSG